MERGGEAARERERERERGRRRERGREAKERIWGHELAKQAMRVWKAKLAKRS